MKRKCFSIAFAFAFFFSILVLYSGPAMAAEPYVLGYVADITGMARANYAPEAEGCRLYIDTLNARGGINGHPVKLVIEDGKSQPAASAAVAKKLIVEDRALALLGLGFSSSQPPVIELATKSRVAVIAGFTMVKDVHKVQPGEVCFNTGRIMNPNYLPAAYAYALVANRLHPNGRYAASGYDTPGGRLWSKLGCVYAEKMGLKVVYHEDIPPGTMDLMPWASKVAKANPDIYANDEGGEIFIPNAIALEKCGWTKDLLYPDFVSEGDLVKGIRRLMTNGEWVLWLGRYASSFDNIPEYDRIREAMKKFGHQYPLSAHHAQGWTIGRIAEEGLKIAGWPCTREKFISALEQINLDAKGLTGGSIRYTPTDHSGPTSWKLYRWNASKQALVPVWDWFEVTAKMMGKE